MQKNIFCTPSSFKSRFNRLFADYVTSPREEPLAHISALGEELVRASVPPEDIAEIFEESLIKFAQESPRITLLEAARHISIPLVEMLVAYGISFRQQMERQQIYEETKLAKQIIENTREGIWMADENGILQIVNPAFSHITGYSHHEAVGKELAFFFSDSHSSALEPKNIPAFAGENGHCRKEVVGRRKNGSLYPALLSISAISDDKRQFSNYVGVINDITLQKQDEAVRLELERAKAIYDLIIQPQLPVMDDIGINVVCLPAENIGGDILELLKMDEKRLLFFLADVTGHGISAAMTAHTTKMLFKEISKTTSEPAVICDTLNKAMCRNILQDDIIAAFCGLMDISAMTLRYSLHGLPAPIILRADDDLMYLHPTGFPLGVFEEQTSESKTIGIREGDMLVLMTDGITEIKGKTGSIFGKSGLEKSIGERREDIYTIVEKIIHDAEVFQKKDKFADDIIIMAVGISSSNAKKHLLHSDAKDESAMSPCRTGVQNLLAQTAQSRFSVPNHFILKIKTRYIAIDSLVSRVIKEVSERTTFSPDKLGRLKIAFFEMLANAIEHGNLEMTSLKKNVALYDSEEYWKIFEKRLKSDPYGERLICIESFFNSDHLEISIEDEGYGFTSKDVPDPACHENITASSGRGIALAKMNVDKIIYNTKGNKVIIYVNRMSPNESQISAL